jgi:hypothetical protein
MKLIAKALIAVVVAAVLAAGVAAEIMPLSGFHPKAAPCHRHSQPTQLPSSHPCCQSIPASAIVKSAREEAPTTVAVIEHGVFEKLAATCLIDNIQPGQVRPGDPPGIIPLRI